MVECLLRFIVFVCLGCLGGKVCYCFRVTDLVSFNPLEASAKRGGMADPSGLMVVLLLLLSEGLVARWGGGWVVVPVALTSPTASLARS